MTVIPGLPALPAGVEVFEAIAPIVGDIVSFLSGFGAPVWGIYQNGLQVLFADSFNTFGYKQDWSVLNYPVEEGAFESYNKVNSPFDARVRMISGGSEANRQALLDNIDAIGKTLELYDIVTPEAVYSSVNVTGYDYHRSNRDGAGMITIDIHFIQINVTAQAEFSNTQEPSAQATVSNGTVQGQPTTGTQQAALKRIVVTGGTFVDN